MTQDYAKIIIELHFYNLRKRSRDACLRPLIYSEHLHEPLGKFCQKVLVRNAWVLVANFKLRNENNTLNLTLNLESNFD